MVTARWRRALSTPSAPSPIGTVDELGLAGGLICVEGRAVGCIACAHTATDHVLATSIAVTSIAVRLVGLYAALPPVGLADLSSTTLLSTTTLLTNPLLAARCTPPH